MDIAFSSRLLDSLDYRRLNSLDYTPILGDYVKAFSIFHECHPYQLAFIKKFRKRLTSAAKSNCLSKIYSN